MEVNKQGDDPKIADPFVISSPTGLALRIVNVYTAILNSNLDGLDGGSTPSRGAIRFISPTGTSPHCSRAALKGQVRPTGVGAA